MTAQSSTGSSKLNRAQAATGVDMTKPTTGGGDAAKKFRTGPALARMIQYIECGAHMQSFNGKPTTACMEVATAFLVDGFENETGASMQKTMRPYRLPLKNNEKSRDTIVFKAMNWHGKASHFSQLLGDTFLVNITHEPLSKQKPNELVDRLDIKSFSAPYNDVIKRTLHEVPDVPESEYRLFLWDAPTMEDWDELYVPGTYDDGRSKNHMQEYILSAVNFKGSKLDLMLNGAGTSLSDSFDAPSASDAPSEIPSMPDFADDDDIPF